MKPNLIDAVKAEIIYNKKVLRTKWKFWPTDASCVMPNGEVMGKCIRQLYYQWTEADVTNPVGEFVKTLGRIGCFLEEDARKNYKKKKIYLEALNQKENRKWKVDIFKDGVLSGEVDILIAKDKEHCGIEVKSYSNSTYKIEHRPKDAHLLQTFLYSVFFEPKQDFFLIYYRPSMISKYAESDVYHRIDWVELEGEIYVVINGEVDKRISIKGIVNRFKEAKYYIEQEILPKREFKKSTKNCLYCPYKDKCWKKDKDKEGNKLGEADGIRI